MNMYRTTLLTLAAATALPSLASAQSIGLGGNSGVGVALGGQDVQVGAAANANVGLGNAVGNVAGAARDTVGIVKEELSNMPPPPGADVAATAHAGAHGEAAGANANASAAAGIDLDAVKPGSAVVDASGKAVGKVRAIARNAERVATGLSVELENGTVVTVPGAGLMAHGRTVMMVEGN